MADNTGALPDLQTVARALGGEVNGGQVLAPGPGHQRKTEASSIKLDAGAPDGFVVHSFAADDPIACRDYVREKVGLPAFKPNGSGHQRVSDDVINAPSWRLQGTRPQRQTETIVATYDYTDADGTLLYQVLRYEPKDFRQRRPDGNGGWIWKLDERRVLYRWPELLKFPDATVFITEGEKDADRVADLACVPPPSPPASGQTNACKALAGRDVIILEDNDDAGRKKALEAAQRVAWHGQDHPHRVVA